MAYQFVDFKWADEMRFQMPASFYGFCDKSKFSEPEPVFGPVREICAKYAYLAYYAFFLKYTGNPPTVWDLLSTIYFGELGLWGLDELALEALGRNFFESQPTAVGGCPWVQATSSFECSYESMIKWVSHTFWYRVGSVYYPTGRENEPPFVDVWNIVQIPYPPDKAQLRIREMEVLLANRGPYSSEELFEQFLTVPGGGIFEFPGLLRSRNANAIDMNYGAINLNWRSGQSGTRPSKWGNGSLALNANPQSIQGVLKSFIYANNQCVAVLTISSTAFIIGDCS